MGEATYYMKITFRTPGEAKEALPLIKGFFEEGMQAYEWWQAHRGSPQEKFWPSFTESFPQTTEYLKSFNLKSYWPESQEEVCAYGGDCNNALAGQLDFGSEEDDWAEWCLNTDTAALTYSSMVWHLADWTPLMNFIVQKFDADHGDWISDEDVSPFELLK